jgi:hypothetical protein
MRGKSQSLPFLSESLGSWISWLFYKFFWEGMLKENTCRWPTPPVRVRVKYLFVPTGMPRLEHYDSWASSLGHPYTCQRSLTRPLHPKPSYARFHRMPVMWILKRAGLVHFYSSKQPISKWRIALQLESREISSNSTSVPPVLNFLPVYEDDLKEHRVSIASKLIS